MIKISVTNATGMEIFILSDYTTRYNEKDDLEEVIYTEYSILPLTLLFPRYTSQEPVSASKIEGSQ